jgi:hypothetical protein
VIPSEPDSGDSTGNQYQARPTADGFLCHTSSQLTLEPSDAVRLGDDAFCSPSLDGPAFSKHSLAILWLELKRSA